MDFEPERKPIVAFSAIGLTDIVLLLLIFFLLSSTFILQPGIKVELPEAQVVETVERQILTVTIPISGGVYLNDEPVSLAELPARLQQELAGGLDKDIILRADEDIPFKRAVEIMDIAKRVGAGRFLVATRTKEEGGSQ
ncbi:MAG: biopolymer transporter ExbD [Candidatus Latescibacteria bacterium]|nr:biopolymer transporter ExbD [Candidatus Latescibacterota bacterium]